MERHARETERALRCRPPSSPESTVRAGPQMGLNVLNEVTLAVRAKSVRVDAPG
jgi:hypothetical protein